MLWLLIILLKGNQQRQKRENSLGSKSFGDILES